MTVRFRSAIIQGDTHRSAEDLNALAAVLAEAVGSGVSGGRVVIATADRGAATAAVAGVWQAGHVPVVAGEAAARPGSVEWQQFTHRLDASTPLVALADEAHGELLVAAGYLPEPPQPVLEPFRAWRPPVPPTAPNPTDAALIVFTSGSTGTPKGVVLSEAALEAIAATNRLVYRLNPNDRFLSALPLTHLAGLTNVLAAVAAGVDVVVAPPVAFAKEIQAFVADNKITVAGFVPHQLRQLFGEVEGEGPESLRLVVSSGTRLSPMVAAATKQALPGATLVNAYGLTEAFRSFAAQVNQDDPTDIGQPMLGVSARLVDPETSEPVAVGTVGEIQLRGSNLYSGYWQPDGTVVPPPLWLQTGDLGTVDERGRFHLIGRQSSYVNVGGHKEAIETIEGVLERTAPGQLAVVQGFDDHGLERVVVVAEQDAGVGLGELRRAARCLAPALRPAAVIEIERIPRTAIGKIDRSSLNELTSTGKGQDK